MVTHMNLLSDYLKITIILIKPFVIFQNLQIWNPLIYDSSPIPTQLAVDEGLT